MTSVLGDAAVVMSPEVVDEVDPSSGAFPPIREMLADAVD